MKRARERFFPRWRPMEEGVCQNAIEKETVFGSGSERNQPRCNALFHGFIVSIISDIVGCILFRETG